MWLKELVIFCTRKAKRADAEDKRKKDYSSAKDHEYENRKQSYLNELSEY